MVSTPSFLLKTAGTAAQAAAYAIAVTVFVRGVPNPPGRNLCLICNAQEVRKLPSPELHH